MFNVLVEHFDDPFVPNDGTKCGGVIGSFYDVQDRFRWYLHDFPGRFYEPEHWASKLNASHRKDLEHFACRDPLPEPTIAQLLVFFPY